MKFKKLLLAVIGAAALCLWLYWGNTALQVTAYPIHSSEIPPAFNGFRIAQVSDFHNAQFGPANERLLALLKKSTPDIIVITGDLIDSRNTKLDVSLSFVKEAAAIAPCYYVAGNHELRFSKAERAWLDSTLQELGVAVLHDQTLPLRKEDSHITITGMNESGAYVKPTPKLPPLPEEEGFHILLAHHPELFSHYADAGFDLIFTGHAHGGQIRLPFLGGILVPDQGFFPEYDAGIFVKGCSTMLISRGLGSSVFPLRINNRPELVLADLYCA